MMKQEYPAPSGADHPITPPPKLVEEWRNEWIERREPSGWVGYHIATQAARWGADQELEAVCDEILHCVAGIYEDKVSDWSELVDLLRDSRRPKPPSLKAQALGALGRFNANAHTQASQMVQDFEIIRRAVEQLDD